MTKLYKLVYHFKDGTSWGPELHDVELSAEQLAYMLGTLGKSNDMEIECQSNGEKRKVSEIKSIELVF
ncbi:hypothetical protein [Bacillus alveayuensis]|jgi:hypothetical protein|uniref:hypothetical protein n=1 Tax=Aeribacillus alveayuensis TaxID=279215 RepID=UPI0005D0F760|nr:hypothetical protein [Bacillus alveayuensis]